MSFNTPVLFLIFNRPEVTARVFEEIRQLKPSQLFIAADGARANKPGEAEKCEQTRQVVINNIDWNCEVKTLFRDDNIGCGKAVSGAITWFFDHVTEGIILEDDCLPNLSFFHFCQATLEHYRDNLQIMHVGGTNFQLKSVSSHSYYFSNYFHIWGWATWKRAWDTYKFDIEIASEQQLQYLLKKRFANKYERRTWASTFRQMAHHYIDTWDIQWMYSIFVNNGVGITPMVNMVSNIGFGADATHTHNTDSNIANKERATLNLLKHPNRIKVSQKADSYTYKTHYQHGNTRFNAFKFKLGAKYPFIKTLYLKLKGQRPYEDIR